MHNSSEESFCLLLPRFHVPFWRSHILIYYTCVLAKDGSGYIFVEAEAC